MHVHFSRTAVLSLILTLGIISRASASDADKPAALEAVAQSWIEAFNARDVDALLALATPDVVLLDPNGLTIVSGLEAVRTALRQATTRSTAPGQIRTTTKEIVVIDDVAWRIATLADKSARGVVGAQGQSLEIWKRIDGQWKLHRISAGILGQSRLLRRLDPTEPILN